MICTPDLNYSGDKIKKNETAAEWSTYEFHDRGKAGSGGES